MRLALVGAFPFPVPQGSQVYFAEQARALRRAGADVTLFCHGRGAGPAPRDLPLLRAPAILSPRRLRAGASPLKPAADAALLAVLVAAGRFDAAIAHNAEAGLVALAARAWSGVPVVYVAHALWRHELPCYGPARAAAGLSRIGAALDRALARRADAVLALSSEAAEALRHHARGPVALIPPGLDPQPPPDPTQVKAACARHGLEAGRFALYTGNLDPYQALGTLAEAAARAPDVPFVVVTHDARDARRSAPAPLRVREVRAPGEARALTFAAGVCLLPRRLPGGFPIKLLNYMEASRPVVAHARVADGFSDGVSALLLGEGAGAEAWAGAVTRILADPDLGRRLGAGARALLERRHAWPELARATLELV